MSIAKAHQMSHVNQGHQNTKFRSTIGRIYLILRRKSQSQSHGSVLKRRHQLRALLVLLSLLSSQYKKLINHLKNHPKNYPKSHPKSL